MNVNILGTQLGIHDFLAAVKTIVARQHKADAAGDGDKDQTLCTEQLNASYYGSNGAVAHAAE